MNEYQIKCTKVQIICNYVHTYIHVPTTCHVHTLHKYKYYYIKLSFVTVLARLEYELCVVHVLILYLRRYLEYAYK